MSKLLLDERPLIVLPKLATMIGLNEAIILQQFHFLLLSQKQAMPLAEMLEISHGELQQIFPFMSLSTLRRSVKTLLDIGLLLNPDGTKDGRKLKYVICYDALEKLTEMGGLSTQSGQNEHPTMVNLTQKHGQNEHPSNKSKEIDSKEDISRSPAHDRAIQLKINSVMSTWGVKYSEAGHGKCIITNFPKDRGLMEKLLRSLECDEAELVKRIERYMNDNDPFVAKNAWKIGIFYDRIQIYSDENYKAGKENGNERRGSTYKGADASKYPTVRTR